MNILGNLGPEDSDLIYLVTQPLIAGFYVWFFPIFKTTPFFFFF